MSIARWWPELLPETRDWLIANNGDAVPESIVQEVAAAGGPPSSDPWWAGDGESPGWYLPDDAIDWIELVANDETPPRE